MSSQSARLKLSVILAAFLAAGVLTFAQDPGVSSGKRAYVRSDNSAGVSGTILFTGIRPASRQIDTSADPVCTELSPDLRTERVVGNPGRLANVVVYVKSEVLDTYSFEPPTEAAVLEHRGCRYVPHVLGMQQGQPLMLVSRDATHHNTHPITKNNKEWSRTQPPGTPPITTTFARAEAFIPFKDNQHPWEKAYVGVFSHPFFAISDQNGDFRIEGLPPGQYTVIAWHEDFGEKTTEVVFVSGESRYVNFEFDAKDGNQSGY